MDPVEFRGHLPITTVMWYFDTHLFYLKQDKSFKPAFVFIDHQPDLVCKIAPIEPDSRMYLLGVTSDNLSDWVNTVQTQLNHVLTQGSKPDASGNWDQQANWSNRGTPLWVRDDKVGSDALSLKEEETVEKGQAAESLAPAKRKSTVGNQPPRRRRLPPSLRQRSRLPVQNPTRAMGMKRSRARKKRRRKRRSLRARQRRKWQRSRGPRKPGPELHSSSQPVSPNQEASPQSHRLRVRRPLLRHWVLRCKLFRRKSNFFACSDILCARARAMYSSSTTFMLSPCAAHFFL